MLQEGNIHISVKCVVSPPNKDKKNKFLIIGVVLVAAILFYLLYISYVPTSDDMFYKFICNDINKGAAAAEAGEGSQYIDSFSDVIKSMNWFYLHINGRYLVHIAVQACTAMMHPAIYGILNSIFYFSFLLLLCRFSISDRRNSPISKTIICISCAWLLIPFQGNTFLGGVATSVNYLWTSVFTLCFVLLQTYLSKNDNNRNIPFLLILFLFGAFVGSLQESFSIGLAGTYFFYLVLNRKKAKNTEWYLLIGLFIGACFCVFAPGNMVRLSSQGTSAGHSSFLLGCLSSWAIDFFLLSVVTMFFLNKKSLVKTLLSCKIFLGIIFFNALFCEFIAYIGRHQLICISVCSLIITFRIWGDYRSFSKKVLSLTACFLLIISIFLYCYVYDLRKTRYESFTTMCQQAIEKGGRSYVSCRGYDDINYVISNNPLVCHYYVGYMPFVGDHCMKRALSLSLSRGNNAHLFDNLYPDEPSQIANLCVPNYQVNDSVYRVFNNHYILVSKQSYPIDKVKTKLNVKGRAFFLPNSEEAGTAREHFEWKGYHYYLLGNRGALSPIVGIKEINIEP